MISHAEPSRSKPDIFKLTVALMLVLGAIGAFYHFTDRSLLIRVIGLLATAVIAILIALQTDLGAQVRGFFKESQTEVRKVVWPTRQETVQTTLMVILMVVLVAIFLWLLDMLLGWAVRLLTGPRG